MIEFTRTESGFMQHGRSDFEYGTFEWLKDGVWHGTGVVEPVSELVSRMKHDPSLYRYSAYRILKAERPTLVIKPTCAGCGAIAGVDCQKSCEYLFGRTTVAQALPITFNEDHQFSLSVKVSEKGKNFDKAKSKIVWFNSVRCAELFLTEHGLVSISDEPFGSGARLLQFLGDEVVRKKRAPNVSYLARLKAKALAHLRPHF